MAYYFEFLEKAYDGTVIAEVKVCLKPNIVAYMYLVPYVIVIAWEEVLYAEYSTRGGIKRTIQNEAKPSAVLFSRPCPECYILRAALPSMP